MNASAASCSACMAWLCQRRESPSTGRRERPISRTWISVSGEHEAGEWRFDTNEAGEGEFQEEEVGGALVAADFAEGHRAGFIAAGLAGLIFVYWRRCQRRFMRSQIAAGSWSIALRFLGRETPTLRHSDLSPGGFGGPDCLSRGLAACGGAPGLLLEAEGNGARGSFGGLLLLACHCA